MKRLFKAVVLATVVLGFTAPVVAEERATLDEAKAMVKKARAYIREVGPDKAFAEISNPKGRFVDRELYVFVNDKTGVNMAHGANAKLIGKNLMELRDTDGVYMTKQFFGVASKGGGTVDYRFLNPVTKTIEPKTAYVEMEGDYLVGSGIFRAAK
ncbi:cache domain-containing protein [Ramlibacter sp. AN1133]|uniref:cache domain-containing protein n=1 Tax=Ramlibacter sp. AN1133 TaxID=3133429 RepID=UPI0030BAC0DC